MEQTEATMATTAESIGGNGHDAGARADEALRRKASQLQKFFDDVEELLERVGGMDEPEVARLRSRVEASIERARDSVRSGAQIAVENTRKAAIATDEYVHRNPWLAIGATATIGLLLGALLRGPRK
jgi:ElaB/YqjD/DUF883 family membrane-anchored ribosome-binding protein